MTDVSFDHLHPDLKPLCQKWLDQCRVQHINVRITETWRSAAEQNRLYAIGRDAQGNVTGRTVTKARGGQSKHNFTLPDGTPASKAFDFAIIGDDGACNWNPNTPQWKAAVAMGKALCLHWGGDFPNHQYDACHFEIT